jgi:poly(A) polymerase
VLAYTLELETNLAAYVGDAAAADASRLMAVEVAGGWSGADAVRLGALLHDIAKPRTRVFYEDRQMVGFPNHDRVGQQMTGDILDRLRFPRKLIRTVQSLTLHHLRLGFLVHAQPLDEGGVYDYLRQCDPVEVEVTVLALADRLATRGRNADAAIGAHTELTRVLLPRAVQWREAGGAPSPLLDGDQLSAALGRPPGQWLAAALEAQRRARFIDPALTTEQSLEVARSAAAAR